MYFGGYVTVELGVRPFLGGGLKNNKIFERLEYARKSHKPVMANMLGVNFNDTQTGEQRRIVNYVDYVYYPEGITSHQDNKPAYVIVFVYADNNLELKTTKFWIKKED